MLTWGFAELPGFDKTAKEAACNNLFSSLDESTAPGSIIVTILVGMHACFYFVLRTHGPVQLSICRSRPGSFCLVMIQLLNWITLLVYFQD